MYYPAFVLAVNREAIICGILYQRQLQNIYTCTVVETYAVYDEQYSERSNCETSTELSIILNLEMMSALKGLLPYVLISVLWSKEECQVNPMLAPKYRMS